MKTRRPMVIPLAIAAISVAVTAYITWLMVRADAHRWTQAGFAIGPELKFVFFFSVVIGGVAFAISRRLIHGPAIVYNDWILTIPALPKQESGYRESKSITVADLLDRLARRGYQLSATAVDVHGEKVGPMDARAALAGVAVSFKDPRLGGWSSSLVLRISAMTEHSAGIGAVETRDVKGAGYQELATFVIAELDGLIPGVRYKLGNSGLSADLASELHALLPTAPLALAPRKP
jgi:hypothetical protein